MAMLESECIPVNEKLFSRYDMSMNMNIPIGFSFHLTGDRAAVPIAVALPNAPPLKDL